MSLRRLRRSNTCSSCCESDVVPVAVAGSDHPRSDTSTDTCDTMISLHPQHRTDSGNQFQEYMQKQRFAVFVKILFKELDGSEDACELRNVAKAIVLDCIQRNRLGDPAYHPLMDALDERLRRHVGEIYWRRAHLYLQHYMTQRVRATRLTNPTRLSSS